jgi:pimeloyl-ACP methyl ester carboxylesterase
MLYWVTEAAVSSFRYYWEGAHNRWKPDRDSLPVVRAPTGVALFPKEPFQPPDLWLKSYYNLHRISEMTAGGHFAPAEEPEQWVNDVRAFFRPLRP